MCVDPLLLTSYGYGYWYVQLNPPFSTYKGGNNRVMLAHPSVTMGYDGRKDHTLNLMLNEKSLNVILGLLTKAKAKMKAAAGSIPIRETIHAPASTRPW